MPWFVRDASNSSSSILSTTPSRSAANRLIEAVKVAPLPAMVQALLGKRRFQMQRSAYLLSWMQRRVAAAAFGWCNWWLVNRYILCASIDQRR